MIILNNIHSLLNVAEMYKADALTIDSGISGIELMESAGRSVAQVIQSQWEQRPVSVLCGPGNNGGDGFVIARYISPQSHASDLDGGGHGADPEAAREQALLVVIKLASVFAYEGQGRLWRRYLSADRHTHLCVGSDRYETQGSIAVAV